MKVIHAATLPKVLACGLNVESMGMLVSFILVLVPPLPTPNGWRYRQGRENRAAKRTKRELENAALTQTPRPCPVHAALGAFLG